MARKTTASGGEAAPDVEMDGRFWHDVFDMYFFRSPGDDRMTISFSSSGDRARNVSVPMKTGIASLPISYAGGLLRYKQHCAGRRDGRKSKLHLPIQIYVSPLMILTPLLMQCIASMQVLTDMDHCYCVIHNANDGAAFPSQQDSLDSDSNQQLPKCHNFWEDKRSQVTLFSGFESYHLVREAYDEGRSGLGSLFSLGQSSERPERLL